MRVLDSTEVWHTEQTKPELLVSFHTAELTTMHRSLSSRPLALLGCMLLASSFAGLAYGLPVDRTELTQPPLPLHAANTPTTAAANTNTIPDEYAHMQQQNTQSEEEHGSKGDDNTVTPTSVSTTATPVKPPSKKPITPIPITAPLHTHTVSLPGVSPSESAVRLLLNQESHMAEAGPRLLFGFGRFLVYTWTLLVFTLWWFQGSILYMPSFGRFGESKQTALNTKGFRQPSDHGLPYEECWIRSEDGTYTHAWLILQPASESAPTIVFFHGNAGNIGYRLPNAKSLYYTTRANILLVEYRGYGHSSGEPSESGIRLDARAALRYLRKERMACSPHLPRIDLSRIYLFGRSLGGAVAIATAHDDQAWLDANQHLPDSQTYPPIAGLLIENTFVTLVEMVLVLASRVGLIPRESNMLHTSTVARVWRRGLHWLMTNRWDTYDSIRNLRVPMLFLSGLADELIPSSHSAGLFHAAQRSERKQLYTVETGTHNDTFVRGGMEYYETIFQFITHEREQRKVHEHGQDVYISNQ